MYNYKNVTMDKDSQQNYLLLYKIEPFHTRFYTKQLKLFLKALQYPNKRFLIRPDPE